ncbi:MAG: polysaccharide deacetylase family protein [Chloroflexi bacterium]|nr:polysaccharide deacetylase family protein [Chloroflexota bacterium]
MRELHVPILMYHYLSTPPENADAIRLDLSVPPEQFEQAVAYFAAQGYQTVKLQALYDAVAKGSPLPPRPIVFTFDDGYADAYVNAMPILKKYNFTGTFYVITGFVGRPGYLTWAQIGEMAKEGMDIQSHSVTHIPLKGKSADVLRRELGDSKRTLERMIGQPVNFICYPSGQYDELTMVIAQEVGYLSATTTHAGVWENDAQPFEWPRIRIHGHDQLGTILKRLKFPELIP